MYVSYFSRASNTVRSPPLANSRLRDRTTCLAFSSLSKDTSNPPKLQAAYDGGDGLHLNPTGYQKMTDTVDITLLPSSGRARVAATEISSD